MKVLFLYDDAEHAVPLLRAVPHLAECGVELAATETHSQESAVRLVTPDVDLVLMHQTLLGDDALDHGKPVVALERIDGAQLAASRRWLSSVTHDGKPQPSVACVVKGYTYRDIGLHNSHRGRYHAHLLDAAGLKAAAPEHSSAVRGLPSPQLSTADLRKVTPGYGFGAYAKMDQPRTQMLDWASGREFDVHCVCYVDYRGSEIEAHRRAAVEAVREYGEKRPGKACWGEGRALRHDEYLRSMFASKTVVSPWGWGEACHRDYEAMLLGAVLVKPPMDHVTCWPDIYKANETYIPCRLDFGDLSEIVDRVRSDWPSWQKRRQEARRLAMEAGDPRRVARRLAGILEWVNDHRGASGGDQAAV